MDINQLLLKRKIEKSKKLKSHNMAVKRKYHGQKKYFEQDLDKKLENDILNDKKKQFYDKLFTEGEQVEKAPIPKTNQQKQKQPQELPPQQNKPSKRAQRKQQRMVKKVYTQRTKSGQPVMKNYLNILVQQIEKQKK